MRFAPLAHVVLSPQFVRHTNSLSLHQHTFTPTQKQLSGLLAVSAAWFLCCAYSVSTDYHIAVAYVTAAQQVLLCAFLTVTAALPSLAMNRLLHDAGRFHTVVPQVCDNRLYSHIISQKDAGLWLFGVTGERAYERCCE